MDWKNQLTKTPYLVLFIVLISIGVGTASAVITITLAGDVDVTGNLDVIGTITGQTITNLQNQINAAGISVETETQIDNIEGNITSSTFGLEEIKNEVRFIEGNVTDSIYIPFKKEISPLAGGFVCDLVDGGSSDTDTITINSDKTTGFFLITGINFVTSDVDEMQDEIAVLNILVDGGAFAFSSGDITGDLPNGITFDIMGYQGVVGKFPHQIVAESNGAEDVKIIISCQAGTTTDIDFNLITVSGWKRADEQISVTYAE